MNTLIFNSQKKRPSLKPSWRHKVIKVYSRALKISAHNQSINQPFCKYWLPKALALIPPFEWIAKDWLTMQLSCYLGYFLCVYATKIISQSSVTKKTTDRIFRPVLRTFFHSSRFCKKLWLVREFTWVA